MQFGQSNFSEPCVMSDWKAENSAGIFIILSKTGAPGKPVFSPVFMDESGDFLEIAHLKAHRYYRHWLNEAGNEENIFISVFELPCTNEDDRRKIKERIFRDLLLAE